MLSDRQASLVYQAQTEVVLRHPADDVGDLAGVRAYVAVLATGEGLRIGNCYRAWHYAGGGDELLVHRSTEDHDLVGTIALHPGDGREVTIVAWHARYSHYDVQMDEIVVGGAQGGPLSHRLLLVHEVSHVKKPTDEMHGPEWVQEFEAMTARQLPHLAAELRAALRAWGVLNGGSG